MIILLGVLIVVIGTGIGLYNQLIRSRIKCEEALSGIDVALAKRYDSLTNIQEAVRGYTKHEQAVLTELTKLRTSMTLNEKEALADQYTQVQKQLLMVAEGYPQLQASPIFCSFRKRSRTSRNICRPPAALTMRTWHGIMKSFRCFRPV